jgi:hypothetical protein
VGSSRSRFGLIVIAVLGLGLLVASGGPAELAGAATDTGHHRRDSSREPRADGDPSSPGAASSSASTSGAGSTHPATHPPTTGKSTPQPRSTKPVAPPPPSSAKPPSSSAPYTPPSTYSGNLSGFFGPDFSASRSFCSFSDQNVTIASGVLTAHYPAGSTAPSAGAPYGGAQLCEPFSAGSKTEATLTYRVRFPVGFQFVKGGKMPGLYGGVEPFSGGGHNASGWSMRLMWRTNGAGEVYAYVADGTGYGDSWGRGNFDWQADGQWHTVTEHVQLNSPGQSNGSVTLAYDGVVAIDQTGLVITDNATPIGGLFFSTFYGGHDASWAPSQAEHVDFAGFSAN